MHPHRPPSVGLNAIRRSYERIFSEGKFEINIDVKEIVPIGPDWAFARMESKDKAESAHSQDAEQVASQALVIFQKIKIAEQRADGEGAVWQWRLARSCFSSMTTLPK